MMRNTPAFSRVASKIREEISIGQQASVPNDLEISRSIWFSDHGVYVNRETGKMYRPHNTDEALFISDDRPRRVMVKGGEGSGKSVAGIVKDLERLRRGMSGIMGSPNFVHFKKS